MTNQYIMQLTRYTDYSLRVLIYLSVNSDRKITIKEISSSFKISKNHLVKLGSIFWITSERFILLGCFNPNGKCTISPICELQSVLATALNAFIKAISHYTLADITKKPNAYKKLLNENGG